MKRIIIILFLGVFLCQSFLLTVAFTANTLPISNETIVFLRNVTGSWDIWTYQCSSRELKQITNTLEDEQNPVWLKGNNEIAFIRSGAIYTWSQNGEKRITQENNYRFLSYDKKNHRLLFSKFIKSEEADLGFYDLTTKREGMLLSKPNQQIHAMASGDGNLIYFVDAYLFNSAVVQNIFSYHNRTHAVKPVVNEKKGVFFRPAPSPDGKKLAYISNDNRGRNLYIKDLRSGRVTRIATRENYVDFPCWDNGGQKILANALIGNSLQLVIYDLNAKTNQILDIKGECTEGCW